jgi:glutamate transport system permease protein
MGVSELLSTYGDMYIQALLTTWTLTVISFIGGMVLATIITILRVSPVKPLRMFGDLYVQIFRNIAGVSLLIIMFYALPYLGILFSARVCVIITVTLVSAAFGSENFMTGINTIGIGQIEAARSLGLDFMQMIRLVVIPQALRSAVLPMTNLLIAVMLTTALGSQVPMTPNELTGLVSYINTRTTGGITTFLISALGYVGTALVIGYVGNLIDRKVRIYR